MSKVEALEQVVEQMRLTPIEKFELARWLQRDQLSRDWNRLFARIDRRRKGRHFTMGEIVREVKAFRRERRGA